MSIASVLVLLPMPKAKVMASFCASSAYFITASQVQPSCAAVCSALTGYIACTSSPCFLNQLMRAQGGLVCVPELVGTATQPSFFFARYSAVALAAPYLPVKSFITSSTFASDSAWLCTSQL